MQISFLIVTTAFSLSLGDIYEYLENPPYDEAITMNCPDECPLLYQPICAGGGNYANQCELDCENRHRREMYLPELYPSCHGTCEKCRSEKRKVRRPRHSLAEQFKRLQKKVLITAMAATLLPQSTPLWVCLECAMEHDHHKVCAGNGKTFSSLCSLSCENKRRKARGSDQLKLICDKACSECDNGQENESVVPRINENFI